MSKFNYKIDEENKVVVAFGRCHHKTVVGVAKCADEDIFDVEVGKKLAALRCNLKIAEKRMKFAEDRFSFTQDILSYWTEQNAIAKKYDEDSVNNYKAALAELSSFEKIL